MTTFPVLVRASSLSGEARYSLGHRIVDLYLEFVAGRVRPNTLRAVAFDLKTFLTVVAKDPLEVVAADVFEFLADQRDDRSRSARRMSQYAGSRALFGVPVVRRRSVASAPVRLNVRRPPSLVGPDAQTQSQFPPAPRRAVDLWPIPG